MKKIILSVCCACIAFSACDKKEILKGNREALFVEKPSIKNNSSELVNMVSSTVLLQHTDIFSSKSHAAVNNKMGNNIKVIWKDNFGHPNIQTDPIIYNDTAFFIDGAGILRAVNITDGKEKFHSEICPQKDSVFTGGLTASENTIFISTNTGDVVAFDIKTQKEKWRKSLQIPMRSAPNVVNGNIVVNNIANQLYVLNTKDGSVKWSNFGSREQTIMSLMPTPVIFQNSVVNVMTTGDIICLNLESGNELWSDVLFPTNISESGFVITHIAASPVVSNDILFVSNTESKMCADDIYSGIRLWETDISTLYPPTVIGNSLFMISTDGNLYCLSQSDGSVKWKNSDLAQSTGDKTSKLIEWTAPIIVNGDVVLCNNKGDISFFDSKNGKFKHKINIGKSITRSPIVVKEVMYILTKDADLYGLK